MADGGHRTTQGSWLPPLTDAERAEIQRRVDQQNHRDDPTAYLDEWFEQFARKA